MNYLAILLGRLLNRSTPPGNTLLGQEARVSYRSEGPGGYVVLHWAGRELPFWYEFGGGELVATIDISIPSEWERSTGITLEQREAVARYLAEHVIKDQAPGRRYRLEERFIAIY